MEKGERGIMRMLIGLVACLLMLLGGAVVLAVVAWWLLTRNSQPKEVPVIEIEVPADEPVVVPAVATIEASAVGPEAPASDEAEPGAADELERIEGIGPKIATVLRAAGIVTFARLAATEVSQIEQILEDESPRLRRLAHPDTWPEQAALAASGEWEALAALQQELKGGRRVGRA
jgi:predicted flap endonuclease-1-like 5' DNA nuclease